MRREGGLSWTALSSGQVDWLWCSSGLPHGDRGLASVVGGVATKHRDHVAEAITRLAADPGDVPPGSTASNSLKLDYSMPAGSGVKQLVLSPNT